MNIKLDILLKLESLKLRRFSNLSCQGKGKTESYLVQSNNRIKDNAGLKPIISHCLNLAVARGQKRDEPLNIHSVHVSLFTYSKQTQIAEFNTAL